MIIIPIVDHRSIVVFHFVFSWLSVDSWATLRLARPCARSIRRSVAVVVVVVGVVFGIVAAPGLRLLLICVRCLQLMKAPIFAHKPSSNSTCLFTFEINHHPSVWFGSMRLPYRASSEQAPVRHTRDAGDRHHFVSFSFHRVNFAQFTNNYLATVAVLRRPNAAMCRSAFALFPFCRLSFHVCAYSEMLSMGYALPRCPHQIRARRTISRAIAWRRFSRAWYVRGANNARVSSFGRCSQVVCCYVMRSICKLQSMR
jgi:hypothetical protein